MAESYSRVPDSVPGARERSRRVAAWPVRLGGALVTHGGDRGAEALRAHGVPVLLTLCGGHISPLLTAAKAPGIRGVDGRHEATAVFAADAVARLTGVPGVAAVTAGPGLTNALTALKNAQLAQSLERSASLTEELAGAEAALPALVTGEEEANRSLEAARASLQEARNREKEMAAERESGEAARREIENRRRQTLAEKASLEGRIQGLRATIESFEGLPSGARARSAWSSPRCTGPSAPT